MLHFHIIISMVQHLIEISKYIKILQPITYVAHVAINRIYNIMIFLLPNVSLSYRCIAYHRILTIIAWLWCKRWFSCKRRLSYSGWSSSHVHGRHRPLRC